jgi:hypothetical protein
MTYRLEENLSIRTLATNGQLVLSDRASVVEFNSASALSLTIPPDSTVDFPEGAQVVVSRYGSGSVQIVAGSGVTLRSVDGNLYLSSQYSLATLIKRASNEWYVIGDLASS